MENIVYVDALQGQMIYLNIRTHMGKTFTN